MNKSYILSIDLGTSSLKAAVYTGDMKSVLSEKQEYGDASHATTAEDWWAAFMAVIKRINEVIALEQISCVSFSGYNALVGVDKNANPVSEVIVYTDNRPREYAAQFMHPEDEAYIFSKTKNILLANGMTALSIMWLRKNQDVYNRASSFLYSSGFIAARLTGRFVTDVTRASLSLLFDPAGEGLAWDEELCNFFKIDRSKLPDIIHPWDAAGTVTEQAASLTGLTQGIPVVIGGMDSMCAAIGSGIMRSNQLLDIGGSAGGLSLVSDQPMANSKFYLVRYMLPNLWASIAPLNAASRLFVWFLNNIAPDWTYDEMMERIKNTPPFSRDLQFMPYINGSRYPYWDPKTNAGFVNISLNTDINEMACAVVESVGFVYRQILEDIRSMGIFPSEIIPAGGDAGSKTWIQIKSDIMMIPYALLDNTECSTLGAAIMGANNIGIITDVSDFIQKNVLPKSYILPNYTLNKCYSLKYQTFISNCNKYYSASNKILI